MIIDDLPPMLPNTRLPYHGPVRVGSQDRDNFVRNLITVLGLGWAQPYVEPLVPVQQSESAAGRTPVLTLPQIKLHCRIELDQTAEDALLTDLEMAAHIHTENRLRYLIDDTIGENVKQAMLMLIAHWYRNRESVSASGLNAVVIPMGYDALLSMERDYSETY